MDSQIEAVYKARDATIGWIDRGDDALYLDPDSVYAVAQRLGRDTGKTIPNTVTTLGKWLQDANRLVSTELVG